MANKTIAFLSTSSSNIQDTQSFCFALHKSKQFFKTLLIDLNNFDDIWSLPILEKKNVKQSIPQKISDKLEVMSLDKESIESLTSTLSTLKEKYECIVINFNNKYFKKNFNLYKQVDQIIFSVNFEELTPFILITLINKFEIPTAKSKIYLCNYLESFTNKKKLLELKNKPLNNLTYYFCPSVDKYKTINQLMDLKPYDDLMICLDQI